MDQFTAAFAALAEQLRQACDAQAIWKDADPTRWRLLPAKLSQHRHPFCLGIKRDAQRLVRCCSADNAAPPHQGPQRRRCPFGVTERIIPVRRDGNLLGWCFLGLWGPATDGSPPQERTTAAEAAARIADRLLAGIIHLHPGASGNPDPRLAAVRTYMDAHLAIDLRAADAAAHIGLSTSRFVHWFVVAAGQPWSQELRQRIMTRAADLLRRTSRSVTDIGMSLGFASPASFTTAFSRHHGKPPAAWRRTMAMAGE